MQSFYERFVRAGDVVFDVGAFHGSRTSVFRALGASVVAVEPVRESVRTLFARFAQDPLVTIVPSALGAAEGTATIVLSTPNLYSSSLSDAYREAGVGSRRYPAYGVSSWQEERTTQVTTLDALIRRFGRPAFTKIDVEGYEDCVLGGLSQWVPALSFEFHPHILEPALRSLGRLSTLGEWRMNFAIEERFQWQLKRWITADEMAAILSGMRTRTDFLYGDVYARHEGRTK